MGFSYMPYVTALDVTAAATAPRPQHLLKPPRLPYTAVQQTRQAYLPTAVVDRPLVKPHLLRLLLGVHGSIRVDGRKRLPAAFILFQLDPLYQHCVLAVMDGGLATIDDAGYAELPLMLRHRKCRLHIRPLNEKSLCVVQHAHRVDVLRRPRNNVFNQCTRGRTRRIRPATDPSESPSTCVAGSHARYQTSPASPRLTLVRVLLYSCNSPILLSRGSHESLVGVL